MPHASDIMERKKTYEQLANNLYMHLPSKKKDELMSLYRTTGGQLDEFFVNHFWWILGQFDDETRELTRLVVQEMWKDLDRDHQATILEKTEDPITYGLMSPKEFIYPPTGGEPE